MKLTRQLPRRPFVLLAICGFAAAACAQQASPQPSAQPPAQPAAQPPAQPAPQEKTPDGKIIVEGVDNIPKHTYLIKMKPSELFNSREDVLALAREVKANLEGDLAKYEIKDARNRMGIHGVLATIAIIEDDLETAQRHYDIMRDLDTLPGTKALTGQFMMSAARTARLAKGDAAKHAELFDADIKRRLSALPWKVIKPELEKIQSRATVLNMDYIQNTLVGGFDPYFTLDGGRIEKDVAYGVLGMRASADNMVPVAHLVDKVISDVVTMNTIVYPDIWTPNQADLSAQDNPSPVFVGVWTSGGIDAASLTGSLWTNPSEQPNGVDDDNNDFVDDIHGIAFDYDATRDAQLLLPLIDMQCEPSLVETHFVGAMEYQAGLRTPRAMEYLRATRYTASSQVRPLLDDFRLLRDHRLGTLGASLAIKGNASAKVVGVRMTNEYKSVARAKFNEEWIARRCKSITDSVNYLKASGVRIVVLENVLSKSDLELSLTSIGVKDPSIRSRRADMIIDSLSKAFQDAIRSSPEMLFLCPAPTSTAPGEPPAAVPASLNEANLLVVGAMKNSGEPDTLTTKLDAVWCFVSASDVSATASDNRQVTASSPTLTAAVAANTAAKMLAIRPQLTISEVVNSLRENATPCPELPGKFMLNPKQTLTAVRAR